MDGSGVGQGGRPTMQAAHELQIAFDHFNEHLFAVDGNPPLPQCLITLQRQANCFGYFSPGRFVHRDGVKQVDELAVNPDQFARYPIVEILQTLVHEMVHQWQHHHGAPGRRGYHNREWGQKMIAVGLMPSSTGKPGGAQTGEKMADYPIPGGPFLAASRELLTRDFRISWYDRFAAHRTRMLEAIESPEQYAELEEELGVPLTSELQATWEAMEGLQQFQPAAVRPSANTRLKYRCGGDCGAQVWGKPNLRIRCEDCETPFAVAAD